MLEIKFKKRYRDYNRGDVLEVTDQRLLTRLLVLDVIEFPGKRYLVKPAKKKVAAKKPTLKGTAKKKSLTSVSKPKTAKETAESSG
jgi:hypothetical protein